MFMRLITLLWAFVFAAILSSGITLFPMTVAWSSIWVYITFILCLIPGALASWLTGMLVMGIFAAAGIGTFLAGALTLDTLEQFKRRKRM